MELLTAADELALMQTLPGRARMHKSSVHRARKDPAHPAYRDPATQQFTDPRSDTTVLTGRGGDRIVARAPKDAVLKFWANYGPGPKPRTPEPQEQQ